jgi:hypothetical protein
MKLVVNAYMSVLMEGVTEALELAGRLGIGTARLAEAIEGGPLDAPIVDAKLHKMQSGDFAPEFPLEWALGCRPGDRRREPDRHGTVAGGAEPRQFAAAGVERGADPGQGRLRHRAAGFGRAQRAQ